MIIKIDLNNHERVTPACRQTGMSSHPEINRDGKMIKGITTLKELHTPNELFFSVERFQRSE